MPDREKPVDESAPRAGQDPAELSDDALEEVAGGYGDGVDTIGPPPFFPPEVEIGL